MKKYEKFDLLWSTFRKEWLDEAMENYEKEESAFSYLSCPEDYTKFDPVQRLIDTCEDDFEVDVIDCRKIRTPDQAFGALYSLNEGSVVIIEYPDAIYDSEDSENIKDTLSNIWKVAERRDRFVRCSKHLTICPFLEGNGNQLPWDGEHLFGKIDEIEDIYARIIPDTPRPIDTRANRDMWNRICQDFRIWMDKNENPQGSNSRRSFSSWVHTFPKNYLAGFQPNINEFIDAWNIRNKNECIKIVDVWDKYLTDRLQYCRESDRPTINNVRAAIRKFGSFVVDVL